jgi:hypothetical protein
MLCEICCDEFHQKRITFHQGLNVILGDNQGTNSIGKSTLLMIIDFVFGGTDYVTKSRDVHKNVGSHQINFCFEFNSEKFFFCRKNEDSDRIYECDEKYDVKNEISLSKYTEWLKEKYSINLEHITFRDMVNRFFRVYGKENLNEKHPLDVVSKEPSREAVKALLKIMNYYDDIKRFEEIYKQKSERFASFKNAQKYDFLPQKMNKRDLEKMQKEINHLKIEKENLEKQIAGNALDLETEKIDSIVLMRKELSIAKRQKTRYESQLYSLREASDSDESVRRFDLTALQKYFPEVNVRDIAEIQIFHKKLNTVLTEEIKNERSRLEQLYSSAQNRVSKIINAINDVKPISNVSTIVLKKYANIQNSYNELERKLAANDQYSVLDNEKKTAETNYQCEKEKKIAEMNAALNNKINEINNEIYDGNKKAPIFTFTENNYEFSTSDDTGTGTSFKNMIIFDLSILNMTDLPALIHDSYLLKQIADMPIEKLLQLYKQSSKQIFIALDKASSYTDESQKILNAQKVIELSNGGNELFGRSWSDK